MNGLDVVRPSDPFGCTKLHRLTGAMGTVRVDRLKRTGAVHSKRNRRNCNAGKSRDFKKAFS